MSTTVRQAFGDMSSAGTGKFAAALLISTVGSAEGMLGRVERGCDLVGLADVAHHGGAPGHLLPRRPLPGVEVLLLRGWR